MSLPSNYRQVILMVVLFFMALSYNSCETNEPVRDTPDQLVDVPGFPEFITPNEDYFKLSITGNHSIDGAAYGSRRIAEVEISVDHGDRWIPYTSR